MQLGINIPNFGKYAQTESVATWFQQIERSGFDLAMMSDHIAITPKLQDRYPVPFLEAFTTLAWGAAVTSKLLVGTTVVVLPYRNPLIVAQMSANLARLSGGRFILGVGSGWAAQEFEALGVDFGRRGGITDDYLAALSTLFTDDLATHVGEFSSFQNIHTAISSIAKIPLWVGGSSQAAIHRAVNFADAWHPLLSSLTWLIDVGIPNLRETAAKACRQIPQLAPRFKVVPLESAWISPERPLGTGTWRQIEADIAELNQLRVDAIIFDPSPDTSTASPEAALEKWWDVATRILEIA